MFTTSFAADTRQMVCPENEDLCGFEGEVEVTVDSLEITGECPRCGAEIRVELADMYDY